MPKRRANGSYNSDMQITSLSQAPSVPPSPVQSVYYPYPTLELSIAPSRTSPQFRLEARGGWVTPSELASPAVSPPLGMLPMVPSFTPSKRAQSVASLHQPLQISEDFDFDDWNVAIQVEETLYRVHKFFFKRESSDSDFRTRFDETPKGQSITLSGVSCVDFDALLQFMYSAMFDSDTMTLDKWVSVLHLSNIWSMHRIKAQAISHINAMEGLGPVDKIIIAMKEGVEACLVPALASLVKHDEFLSVTESRKIFALGKRQVGPVVGMDIVPLLAQARERFIRGQISTALVKSGDVGEVEGGLRSTTPHPRSMAAAERIVRKVFGYLAPSVAGSVT